MRRKKRSDKDKPTSCYGSVSSDGHASPPPQWWWWWSITRISCAKSSDCRRRYHCRCFYFIYVYISIKKKTKKIWLSLNINWKVEREEGGGREREREDREMMMIGQHKRSRGTRLDSSEEKKKSFDHLTERETRDVWWPPFPSLAKKKEKRKNSSPSALHQSWSFNQRVCCLPSLPAFVCVTMEKTHLFRLCCSSNV